MSQTIEVSKDDLQLRYNVLLTVIKQNGGEAQARVSAHIRAVTGGKLSSIALYHVSTNYSAQEKYDEYALIGEAMIDKSKGTPLIRENPDWSKLKGQLGSGAKAVPEEEKEAASESRPPQTHDDTKSSDVSKVAPVKPEVKGGDSTDVIDILRRAILNGASLPTQSATVDDSHIRLLAREEITGADIEDRIKTAMQNGAFPVDRVNRLIDDAAAKLVRRVELINPNTGESKPVDGLMHPQVTQLYTYLAAGVPTWAWSPAGSGKTHCVRQIAQMLNVAPYVVSVDPTLTVAKLLGYRNVSNGEFVEGYMYRAYKEGGLVGLDEIDTGDPGVVASINALLSNGHYLFPNNETVERHSNFSVIALANTKGTGAVAGYTARNRLDAATLDRFAIVEYKYDAGLESALACGIGEPGEPWKPAQPASQATQKAFVEWVQEVRRAIGESVLISPRASINGCKLLRAGVPLAEVVNNVVTKLCAHDTISRINDSVRALKEVV